MSSFLSLFENIGHLTQFINEDDNEELLKYLIVKTSMKQIADSGRIFERIYLNDAVGR